MSLRLKTLLVGVFALVGLMGVSFAALQMILPSGLARLEEREMREDSARALNALSVNFAQLESAAGDWARWDDTYAFIEDANAAYITSNLTDSAFTDLDLNLMVFVHSSGRVVMGKGYDLEKQKEMPVPSSLYQHLTKSSFLLNHPDTRNVKTGIVSLPEGPLLVVSLPILTSQNEGPSRGTLIFGRFLDSAQVTRLAKTTQLELAIHGWNDPQLPADFQSARAALSDQTPVVVRPLNEQLVASYVLVKDIYDQPALILRAEATRDIYQQGQTSITYLTWALFVIGVAFCAITFFVVERLFVVRLTHLGKEVWGIGIGATPTRRVGARGDDEIAHLARDINRMLEAIEQSQNALRESEDKYRNLVERANDGIVIIQDGQVRYANARVLELWGGTAEQVLGTPFTDYVAPEFLAVLVERYQRRIAGEHVAPMFEAVLWRKDGTPVYAELNAGLVTFDGKPADLVIIRDLTERKRAEEELGQLKEFNERIVQNMAEGITVENAAGYFTFVNPAAARLLGYTPDELTGAHWTVVVPPDQQAIVQAADERRMRGSADRYELQVQCKDGMRRLVWISGTPRVENGKFAGSLAVFTDITERKHAEAALQEYSERLAQMVEERTRELRDAQEQLLRQERLTVLGQIAGGIGHELRSPLGAIKNAVYLLNLSLQSPDPDTQEMMEILKRQVDASDRVITSLLDFACLQPPYRRETDLRETIDAALGQITVPENITVSRRFDDTFPALSVDPDQLEIAFSNLIRNAVQAMPDGGRLTIDARSFGKEISISFSDTGVGIAPDVLDKIFQPMFSTKAHGIGLGLALCKLLVEGHGGRIEVTSQVGKGTTIVVYLPLPHEARDE